MNAKKLVLIKTALGLFYAHGVNTVGINQVLQQSGIAKKTLYHHFASKEELVLATLQYRDDIFISWFKAILESEACGQQAILAIFYALDDWLNNRTLELAEFNGCFFINTAAEHSDINSPIRQYCRRHKLKIKSLINQRVSTFTTSKIQCAALTQTICLLKEGIIVSASVEGNSNAAIECIPTVRKLLDMP